MTPPINAERAATWLRHQAEAHDIAGLRFRAHVSREIAQLIEAQAAEIAARDDLLGVAEQFLNACYSAWSCGEPSHRVRKMVDLADQLRDAVNARKITEVRQ